MDNWLTRLLKAPPPAKPKTIDAEIAGKQVKYFEEDDEDLTRNRRIYEQGGVVSEAVDLHALFMFTNGYRLEGPEDEVEEIGQRLEDIDFEMLAWKLIADSLVVKKGIGEIVPTRKTENRTALDSVAAVYYRKAERFEERYDNYGQISGYKQTTKLPHGSKEVVEVKTDNILRIDLGIPLISRCIDEILRDTAIAEGTSKSIERHGFPRYHIKIGQPGESIQSTTLTKIGRQFEDLKPRHEMATPQDVDIVNIDNMGVPNVKTYGDWSMLRLCAAMGVPEELMGLGRGSTEATANVKLQAWYDKIGTLQRRFSSQVNRQLIDRMSEKPGTVKLVLNDVSPVDDLARAQVVSTILTATGPLGEPIITQDEAREMLGLKPMTEKQKGELPERGPSVQDYLAQSQNTQEVEGE